MFDILHTFDLGITQHILGSTLFSILYVDMTGTRDKAHGFNLLWLRLQKIMEDMGMEKPVSKLLLKHIVVDAKKPFSDYPCLRQLKAAESRALARPIAVLASEYVGEGPENHKQKHRLLVCKALVKLYDLFEARARSEKVVKIFETMTLSYGFLAKDAMDNGQLMWSIVPKFHFGFHLCEQAVNEDMTYYWCYSGEDFVGRIARLGHLVAMGKSTHTIIPFLADRYRIGFFLRNFVS